MNLRRLTFVILLVLAGSLLPSCSKETLKDSKTLQDQPRMNPEERLTATSGSLMKLSKTWMESGPCVWFPDSRPVAFFWYSLEGKAGVAAEVYQQVGGVGTPAFIAATSNKMGGGMTLYWSAIVPNKYYIKLSYGNASGWVSKMDFDKYGIATIPGTSVSVGMRLSPP